MPILCEPATSSGRLLYTIGGDVHAVDSLTDAARLLDRDPTEFLVVIGPKAPTNEALAFAASLRMSRPAVGVILTRHEVDVALLTSALQSGVREVVRAGDDAALTAACRRSYEVSRRMVAEAPVVPLVGGEAETFGADGDGDGVSAAMPGPGPASDHHHGLVSELVYEMSDYGATTWSHGSS